MSKITLITLERFDVENINSNFRTIEEWLEITNEIRGT